MLRGVYIVKKKPIPKVVPDAGKNQVEIKWVHNKSRTDITAMSDFNLYFY